MIGKLLRIESSYFVVGIICYSGEEYFKEGRPRPRREHRCPPIVGYMKRWTVGRILGYCRIKGWKYSLMD